MNFNTIILLLICAWLYDAAPNAVKRLDAIEVHCTGATR